MDKETRQESSIPVQSRVSLITLAELASYWEKEGYGVRTMSQLIAWSLDMLCEVIKRNGAMPVVIESVLEAHKQLEHRGLYQGSMKERAYKKIGAALRFETLRGEGVDPKDYTPTDYNILHNKRSVVPSPIVGADLSDEDLRKIAEKKLAEVRLQQQQELYEINRQKKEAMAALRARGELAEEPVKAGMGIREGMTDKELAEYDRLREEEVRAKEKEALDPEAMRKLVVRE